MNPQEQANLVIYGNSIGVKVTPVVVDGELAVNYRDHQTKDPQRAHKDLLAFSCEVGRAA
jgi:hypothetical protein